jgi:hypothetical protein
MISKVVTLLQREYSRLDQEMGKVGKALEALGESSGRKFTKSRRTLSKAARGRIAQAQRLRWAKLKKQAAKLVKA